MKKKYTVRFNYYATYDVEVLAESQEEAKRKAGEIEVPYEDCNFEFDNDEIREEEELEEDLPALIKRAEAIVKAAEQQGETIELDPWLTITTEIWDGERMKPIKHTMELLYWDDDRDSIGFETSEGASKMIISDLPEIEQYQLAKAIIQKGGVENA